MVFFFWGGGAEWVFCLFVFRAGGVVTQETDRTVSHITKTNTMSKYYYTHTHTSMTVLISSALCICSQSAPAPAVSEMYWRTSGREVSRSTICTKSDVLTLWLRIPLQEVERNHLFDAELPTEYSLCFRIVTTELSNCCGVCILWFLFLCFFPIIIQYNV